MEDKTSLFIVAMVGIVGIIGLVVLVMGLGVRAPAADTGTLAGDARAYRTFSTGEPGCYCCPSGSTGSSYDLLNRCIHVNPCGCPSDLPVVVR
ncbi:hypothetical protein JXA12_00290 [Candidatus Woesearchaeota archaeon]|nr:hypothetical protein [Candidatus Woesearchaeota archaeon]